QPLLELGPLLLEAALLLAERVLLTLDPLPLLLEVAPLLGEGALQHLDLDLGPGRRILRLDLGLEGVRQPLRQLLARGLQLADPFPGTRLELRELLDRRLARPSFLRARRLDLLKLALEPRDLLPSCGLRGHRLAQARLGIALERVAIEPLLLHGC